MTPIYSIFISLAFLCMAAELGLVDNYTKWIAVMMAVLLGVFFFALFHNKQE